MRYIKRNVIVLILSLLIASVLMGASINASYEVTADQEKKFSLQVN